MPDRVHFSEPEIGFLKDLFDRGAHRAARSLSLLTDQDVALSVPVVRLATAAAFAEQMAGLTSICGVTQRLHGALETSAMLLFAEEKSLEIVRYMLERLMPYEVLSELHQDAITEVGNIMLNACVGSIAKRLDVVIGVDPPEFCLGPKESFFAFEAEGAGTTYLDVRIDLRMIATSVETVWIFALHEETFHTLKTLMAGRLGSAPVGAELELAGG
ncbi:MAG: hypothetical protein WCO00_11900 [Rhodospirillaceae bacterium]